MSLKHAILGLLDRGPKTGYEIKVHFRDAIKNFWSVSDGQLYPTLRGLSEKGWVEKVETVQDGGLVKHVYAITEAGEAEFIDWLKTPERSIPELKEPFLLKLIFFDRLDKEDALHQIDVQVRRTEDAIEEYQEIRAEYQAGVTSFQRTVTDLGIVMLEARRLFLAKLRDMVAKGRLSRHEPLFNDEVIDLGKELARQLLELVDEGTFSLEELLRFTQGMSMESETAGGGDD
jgi:DNA-binding PadR family transcriptional regulator